MPELDIIVSYNPLRDVKEVISGLAVNIDDMLQTGIVKGSDESLDNNSIDDPNQIIGIVRDEFAAIDAMRAIRKYGRNSKSAQQKASEVAASVGAPAPSGEAEASK